MSAKDIARFSEAARIHGIQVYDIPNEAEGFSVSDALAYVPAQDKTTIAVLNGFIPTSGWYEKLYEEALCKNIRLINSPKEFRVATEFHLAYAALRPFTPTSVVIHSLDELESVFAQLSFPLFIKGATRSLKKYGWEKCVAENAKEAKEIVEKLLSLEFHSRGAVILRTLAKLRHTRISEDGFPLGREYRVFTFKGECLAYGYYWDGEDELAELDKREEQEVVSLARQAALALDVPYLALDVGQTDAGEWIVIEPGDGQCAGFGHVNVLELVHKLSSQTEG